ncbi:hypothetical protein FRB96_007846 [Tulasnella sp. 330]|nr:hypothetical protein FRB96_007846 [Tulasnella sp. 330]KAG8879137.1 hypothetical protein FRB97_001917 [Tulasnella sp. 331]
MSAGKKAGMGVLAKHLQDYTPQDPMYEEYTDARGRKKQRKRELPPGLSQRDADILRKVKKRAHYLDKGFSICGARFGYTGIIGLVPVVGDFSDAALNYLLIIRIARKADIPDWLLSKMLANNAVSMGIGLVPFVGDILLAAWKANSRNAHLLEEFLRVRGEEAMRPPGARHEDPSVVKPGAGGPPQQMTNFQTPGAGSSSLVKKRR